MIRPNALTLLVLGVLVVAGSFAIKRARHSTKNISADVAAETDTAEGQRSLASVPNQESALQSKGSTVTVAQKPGLSPVDATGSKTVNKGNSKWTYSRELSEFSTIKKKVFLTDEERSLRARLIQDRNVVQSMLDYLMMPATPGSEGEAIQNDAINLLLEARAAGDDAAAKVMSSILQDPQIENAKLDMDTRTALAGVKAEILYQWSAQEPEHAAQMAAMLPGPVSKKIWQNVQNIQNRNLAESQQELATEREAARAQSKQ